MKTHWRARGTTGGRNVFLFRGVNTLSLDTKGRLSIPSRYRERLRDLCNGKLILTVDFDHCLLLYPFPAWEEIERKLAALPNLDRRARALQRMLIGHATDCEMDASHRILVPPPLRDYAGLDKHVVMIGQGNKFELWDEQRWNEQRELWLAAGGEAGPLPTDLDSLSL